MCCFSGRVDVVRNTRIYARPLADGSQLLAYAMAIETRADVAMVLPLPVPVGAREDAVVFEDLSATPGFFESLDLLFPMEQGMPKAPPSRAPQPATLRVVHVGHFVASFVPSPADFARLDPRFRLAPGIVDALGVADWGFAVFQLAAQPGLWDRLLGRAAPVRPHPMAFRFPRRDPSRVFFPTVHVHDGVVHPRAAFDHTLYLQGASAPGWEQSERGAAPSPLVEAGAPVWRRRLHGELPNADTWVSPAADQREPQA